MMIECLPYSGSSEVYFRRPLDPRWASGRQSFLGIVVGDAVTETQVRRFEEV